MRGDYSSAFENSPRTERKSQKGLIGFVRKLITLRHEQGKRHSPEELVGTELILLDEVKTKVRERADDPGADPVVLLDFGGMVSMSMVRIAKALSKEIESGEVAVVSSSLKFQPDEFLSSNSDISFTFYHDADVEKFYRENHHRVHFVNGDASTLRDVSIDVPNVGQISLNKHIDIIHEESVLIHGRKNEIDIPRLGNILADKGILFLGTSEKQINMSYPRPRDRSDATVLGRENLSEVGMTPRADIEAEQRKRYFVYQKQ